MDTKDQASFKQELTTLLNRHSMENSCDMPDFLMAEMICRFIDAVGSPIKRTLDWHGVDSVCHPDQTHDFAAKGE